MTLQSCWCQEAEWLLPAVIPTVWPGNHFVLLLKCKQIRKVLTKRVRNVSVLSSVLPGVVVYICIPIFLGCKYKYILILFPCIILLSCSVFPLLSLALLLPIFFSSLLFHVSAIQSPAFSSFSFVTNWSCTLLYNASLFESSSLMIHFKIIVKRIHFV